MEITKLVCDRCGASAEDALARTGWIQLTVASVLGGLLVGDHVTRIHMCTSCTEALLAFVPAKERDSFARHHMRHEETFDLDFEGAVRVAPEATCELKETREHAFRIRRLALLVTKPEDWIVEQIYVGNRNQLVRPNGIHYTIRGSELADRDCDEELETVGERMDLRIVVTYVGKNPEGAEWRGVRVTAIVPGAGESIDAVPTTGG
jgi:hypothetical protein